jgi:hypothetical protein
MYLDMLDILASTIIGNAAVLSADKLENNYY